MSARDASPEVLVVATGTANTASVLAALRRVGTSPRLARDPQEVERAQRVVLPGVGAFDPAARRLDELGLRDVLTRRVRAGRPTLAICLGMQLLCANSEEGEAQGLGVVAETVRRFPEGVRVPHLGWNRVEPFDSELLEPGEAYFANGYRLGSAPEGWAGARTSHAGSFVSALERGAVLACQFHPELSGAWGEELIARWVERGQEAH